MCVGWMKLVGSGGSWRVGWVQHVGWSGGTGVSVAFSTLGGPVCLQCQLGFARWVVRAAEGQSSCWQSMKF